MGDGPVVGDEEPVIGRGVDESQDVIAGVGEIGPGVGGLVGDHLQDVADLAGVIVLLPDPSMCGVVGSATPSRGGIEPRDGAVESGVEGLGGDCGRRSRVAEGLRVPPA